MEHSDEQLASLVAETSEFTRAIMHVLTDLAASHRELIETVAALEADVAALYARRAMHSVERLDDAAAQ